MAAEVLACGSLQDLKLKPWCPLDPVKPSAMFRSLCENISAKAYLGSERETSAQKSYSSGGTYGKFSCDPSPDCTNTTPSSTRQLPLTASRFGSTSEIRL